MGNKFFPYQSHLYCKYEKNVPRPKSWMCRASLWFFIIPLILRVSTQSVWFSRTKRVETLCRKSFLWLLIFSCKRAKIRLTFKRLLEPFFLREKDFCILLSLVKDLLRCLGLFIFSPVERVAKSLIPTSIQ